MNIIFDDDAAIDLCTERQITVTDIAAQARTFPGITINGLHTRVDGDVIYVTAPNTKPKFHYAHAEDSND